MASAKRCGTSAAAFGKCCSIMSGTENSLEGIWQAAPWRHPHPRWARHGFRKMPQNSTKSPMASTGTNVARLAMLCHDSWRGAWECEVRPRDNGNCDVASSMSPCKRPVVSHVTPMLCPSREFRLAPPSSAARRLQGRVTPRGRSTRGA
ncbi:unnamed protein product [Lampetra fluviatilis]